MKKIVLALLISWSSYSQELVKNVTLNLSKKTDVFQIVEEDKKQVSFLADMIEKQIPIPFINFKINPKQKI